MQKAANFQKVCQYTMWVLVVVTLLLLAAWWSWSARAPYATPLEKKKMAWDVYQAAGGAYAPPLTPDEEKELARQKMAELLNF
jgi:hypothetical protein